MVNSRQKPANTFIHNMKYNFRIYQKQEYITDKAYPYFLIYRDEKFDDVAKKFYDYLNVDTNEDLNNRYKRFKREHNSANRAWDRAIAAFMKEAQKVSFEVIDIDNVDDIFLQSIGLPREMVGRDYAARAEVINKNETKLRTYVLTKNIEIDEKDLKIDVYHSSGAGGQGVNTTDSAVRITHIPTGIVVTCQNERSQIQNKATAMNLLKSKLFQIEQQNKQKELDNLKGVVMNIDFGSQIRNYTLEPYSLVKDVRTNYENTNTDKVLNGDIICFMDAYLRMK